MCPEAGHHDVGRGAGETTMTRPTIHTTGHLGLRRTAALGQFWLLRGDGEAGRARRTFVAVPLRLREGDRTYGEERLVER